MSKETIKNTPLENNSESTPETAASRKWRPVILLDIVKVLMSLALLGGVFFQTASRKFLLGGLIELLLIVILSNIFTKKRIGQIAEFLLFLIFNLQFLFQYYAGSYVTTVMVSNISSAEDLGGNAVPYLTGIIFSIIGALIPWIRICLPASMERGTLTAGLIAELLFTWIFSAGLTPGSAFVELLRDEADLALDRKAVQNTGDTRPLFYKTEIPDCIEKPLCLPEQPNIVLILTEGLSQTIIDDPRDVMVNVRELEGSSLFFANYYNHTFATFRGIIGQLFSGYQMNNLDPNNLVSLQGVLSGEGYHTVFINTEPHNEEFTTYLENLGFDEVINPEGDFNGEANSLSDREAYEYLYNTIESLSDSDEPFLTVIYTFGTHTSLNSPDAFYGDGDNAILNKFYNLDVQFGNFWEKFREDNRLADNTLLVFTTDHSTYVETDYDTTFPDPARGLPATDRIPLAIYYAGLDPSVINVYGRNSLDLTPTILDLLDISAENYFLGTSLFNTSYNYYDTLYDTETFHVSTAMGAPVRLNYEDLVLFKQHLTEYYSAKEQ